MRFLFARILAIALLGVASAAAYAEDAPDAAANSAAAPGCAPGSENEGFWQRLSGSYRNHLFPRDASVTGELRYEHALDVDAYSNPTATAGAGKQSQFMFAADLIFHF